MFINIDNLSFILIAISCIVINNTIAVNGILDPRHLFKDPLVRN